MRNLLVDFMNRKQRALPNNPERKLEKTALGLNNIKESPMSRVALNFWGNENVQIQNPQSKSRFLWFQEIQDPLQNLTMREGGMVSVPSGVWTMAGIPQNLSSSLPVKSYIDDQLKESLNKWIEAKKSERRARDKAKEEAKKLQQEKIEKSKRSYQFWTLIQIANESWGDLSRMDTIDKKTANEYFPDLYNDSKGFRNLKTNLEKVFAGEKEYGELLAAYAENKPWYIDDWYTKEEKQWLKQGGRRSETLQNKPLSWGAWDVVDTINLPGKWMEMIDDRAQKIPTANSFLKMENRETKLQKRVKGLSEEERWALEDKYETSPLLKTLYGNFDNYLKATQRTFGDELFDVWYTGVGPNLGKMFANIPSSTVKTLTATGRWITNPADTVAGIGQMILTEEGRSTMKDRYRDNLDKTIEEDPIGTASDALTVAELGAKGVSGGLKVSGLTKNAKIWAVSQKVADFGKTAWEVADLGLGKLYWKGMERLRDMQKNSNNILLKAGATYLRSTQEPLKVASEWLNAGVNKLIGLDKRTKQALENNPFVWKYFEKTKEYIEENGLSPESKKEINTEHIRGLSSEILDMIENKKDTLKDTGELYEKIKNANVKFDNQGVKERLNTYLEDHGIKIKDWKLDFSDSVIVKEGDMKAIEKAYDWATREGYEAKVGLNQRKKMDKIAYPDGAPSAWTEIIRGMRSIFDENMKEKIPGLKEADKLYSEKIKELEQIEDGLIYKQGDRKGQLRDNFEQIVNTLDWPNRARMLQRLDELRPGLWDEIRAVHMMGKLADMYFKTPTKLSGYLTNAVGIVWGGAIGSRYGIGGMILGAISGWLAKQGTTKLSQNAIRKAIDNVAPSSLARLKEVEKKIQAGKGMSPQERALIDQIGARILQESELLNDTRNKTHALPAPEKTAVWEERPKPDWLQGEESSYQRVNWDQKYGVADATEKTITSERAKELKNFRNGRSVEEIAKDYGVEISIVDKITTPEGARAYGKYGDGVITLAEKIKEGTAPHELFHATFDLVDGARKESILEGVMEEKKLDKIQAEEYLADSFSEYFRTWRMKGEKVIWNVGKPLWKKLYDAVKDFFRQVKDWITGVSKNKKHVKQLFDDILDGEIDREMLGESLGDKKDALTVRHQHSWSTTVGASTKKSINITDENATYFKRKLSNLNKGVGQGDWSAEDFFDGLRNNLNLKHDWGYFIDSRRWESATLRISDHFANARNNKMYNQPTNNTSVVIKIAKPKILEDWKVKKNKFKSDRSVDLVEFVYNPENLTPEKMQGVIKGIQDWIDTGEYTDKNYDLTHKSIRATLEGWEVKYQRVYHGSPYEFEKFDSAHIGKGEGAQAHGWGHYVAVDRETGARYANVLPKPKYQGNPNWQIPQGWIENSIVSNILTRLKDSSSVKEAIRKEKMLWNWYEKSERIDRGLKFLDEIKESDFEYQNKNLYEVEIPDNHWVNYLEEQKNLNPEQNNMIKKGLVDFLVEERWFDKKEAQRMTNTILKNAKTGDALYSNLTFQIFFDKKEVSKFLDKIGFDWIHYNWGIDWEAYVIFDNNKLEIKKHEKL